MRVYSLQKSALIDLLINVELNLRSAVGNTTIVRTLFMFHFPTITKTWSRIKTSFFPLQLLSSVRVNNAWHLILRLILHTFFLFFYFCDIFLFHHKYVEPRWPSSPSMINRPFKEALICFFPRYFKNNFALFHEILSHRSFCQWHWLCIWTDMRCISKNQIASRWVLHLLSLH